MLNSREDPRQDNSGNHEISQNVALTTTTQARYSTRVNARTSQVAGGTDVHIMLPLPAGLSSFRDMDFETNRGTMQEGHRVNVSQYQAEVRFFQIT